MTQVTVSSQPVTATVSGNTVVARVPAASAGTATVSGGQGPQGPQGPAGVNNLADAGDVALSSPAEGDVLRYASSKWRNYPEANLVDGGNW